MSQFLLLLHEDPHCRDGFSPEEMQKSTAKYMAWAKNTFNLGGKRLGADMGKVIRANGARPKTTDGPYSETKEVLAGYYLIEAADYDEAVARTLDHPHLEYGGTIEVRQLWG